MNIFDNKTCYEIYYGTKVGGKHMYDQRSKIAILQYKYNSKLLEAKLLKVKFLLGVGELPDVFFIKAVLKKRALIK
jgi:hypothetical protein